MTTVKTTLNTLAFTCAAILTFAPQAAVAGVGIDVNINLGHPPRQVIVAPPPQVVVAPPPQVVVAPPPPVYVAPTAYAPTVVIDDDVQFVYPDPLGFYVAVGVPYDLFYLDNSYFLFRDGRWFRAPGVRGPWVVQRYRELPYAFRRNRLERIREYRTREYQIYNRDRDHYHGRHFRYEKEQWKEQQRDMRERRKDERHFDKEQRKEERRMEKEQRKEEKRFEKEERRERREGRGD